MRGTREKPIAFSKQERADMVEKLRAWAEDDLDITLGEIPAGQLLQFFADEIGVYFYNRGLRDAHALLTHKMEDFADEIYGLERQGGRAR